MARFPEYIPDVNQGIAEVPFIRRGDSAYVIVQGPTWEEAEANAVRLGGHLVAINNKEENDWLSTITYRNPDKIQASYWIGLTDRDIEGTWKWLSGDAYEFSQWNVGHPNSFDTGPDDYVVIHSNSTSPTWVNISNSNTFYRNWGWDSLGIAEIKLAPNNTPTGIPIISGSTRVGSTLAIDTTPIRDSDNFTGYDVRYSYKWEVSTDGNVWSRLTTPDATDNNATYTPTAAESGKSIRGTVSYVDGYGTMESVATAATVVASMANIYGSYLYTIVEGGSWQESETKSLLVGGHLTSILSASENDWLLTNFIPNLQSSYWIGASDQAQEGNWQWSDGSPWSYSNWEVGQPDNASNEDYAQFVPGWNGKWNDLPLTYTVPGIQKTDKGIAKIPFIRRGNSAYVIVQGPTWQEAEANAVRLGGHLASIASEEENDWLVRTFDPLVIGNAWIGFSDGAVEGQWKWTDGSSINYSNWHIGEPNNSGNEDYAAIGLTVGDGRWNDWGGSGLVGIAEIQLFPNRLPTALPSLYGGSAPGQLLVIDTATLQDTDNFFGFTPQYRYAWQRSFDGINWTYLSTPDAVDDNATYMPLGSDVGSKIRGIVSYVDGSGSQEVSATLAKEISTPRITVSVSPRSVPEDGRFSLVYTFSTDLPTAYPLTVSYEVSGTATPGVDYSGINTAGRLKTVTIAQGSTTAIVIVDPNLDSSIEQDETVTLTLAPGNDYAIVGIQSATGLISNDDIQRITPPLFSFVPLPGIRDYDGNPHGTSGSPSQITLNSYKFQGAFDVNNDGTKEEVYTNQASSRWATIHRDAITGEPEYSDHGRGGITRIVGIYIDPLVAEGEANNGRLRNGSPAPARYGEFDSQRRFMNDLRLDNLILRASGDYDFDGFQELYWKIADGTAYLRAIMHADGNIQYANYQSEAQMKSYLIGNGFQGVIGQIL